MSVMKYLIFKAISLFVGYKLSLFVPEPLLWWYVTYYCKCRGLGLTLSLGLLDKRGRVTYYASLLVKKSPGEFVYPPQTLYDTPVLFDRMSVLISIASFIKEHHKTLISELSKARGVLSLYE